MEIYAAVQSQEAACKQLLPFGFAQQYISVYSPIERDVIPNRWLSAGFQPASSICWPVAVQVT